MITLNDYLYSGDTIFKILQKYTDDLENSAIDNHNQIDLVHSSFLSSISDLLEHNEFLTSQSQRLKEFYKYLCQEYPYLAFTFKGRIKSLIRAEEKFNGYIVEYIYDYYKQYGRFPEVAALKEKLTCFRDIIAYRIVISLPKCRLKEGCNQKDEELKLLYDIANVLPEFLENRGFNLEISNIEGLEQSPLLNKNVAPYFRDYIQNPTEFGYQSLHITLYDNLARCFVEVQLRTKSMDDFAEIGPANHLGYEKRQEFNRARRSEIPSGVCLYFDEAYERCIKLQNIDLSTVDVNMFAAANNSLINDGCGLFRGRLILPFEHLSRFQNENL